MNKHDHRIALEEEEYWKTKLERNTRVHRRVQDNKRRKV
jgi:hypothetical protein